MNERTAKMLVLLARGEAAVREGKSISRTAGLLKLKNGSSLSLAKMAVGDNSYSSMMRKLRQEGDKERTRTFQIEFKKSFDEAYCEGLDSIEEIALMSAIKKLDKK